ncbi:MAG: hypothetical protein M0P01_09850 [Treponema sp.]|nr:hypothetical protein [Treponema sp.]
MKTQSTIIISSKIEEKEANWPFLCEKISDVFRLTKQESNRLQQSQTAKLIAAIPYAASCKKPERSAFGNLCLYLAEKQSITGPGDHCQEDDVSVYERLRPFMNLEGGNSAVITHGMQILALIMLAGYNRSKMEDSINGIYNPLNTGTWDFEQLKEYLISAIQIYPCPELDKIISVMDSLFLIW